MEWETVIGLEIHAQLKTRSKIFSGAATRYGAEPNTQACAVDLGLPGVLPVLNAEVVRMAAKLGLATHSTVAPRSVFARKNYFYPDLPKGYQISQYELPIVHGGYLDIEPDENTTKHIGITRAHLEEDAGKSLHEDFHGMTGIDLNRAGTPLLEIVSEPDMRSAKEAVAYMKKIHALVRYLDICDGNMQEGSFRCDANVSVRPKGAEEFGTRTEIKNINSFRFVEQAINYEVERQIAVIEAGGSVVQETRLFDPDRHETRPMRTKEEANDYRYFPDPDLLPVEIEQAFLDDADYFESSVDASGGQGKLSANWVTGELSGALNKAGVDIVDSPVSAAELGGLLQRIEDGTISGKIAKQVFQDMFNGEGSADAIIEKKGLRQISDASAIEGIVKEVLDNNPKQLEQYRNGQTKLLGYFVGQVMQATQGKANPKQVNELLKKMLDA
jgi:aspartyl-tRNA(Asn)/glutamyl-tRNA(Gln) amidotransferase subunit B